MSRQRSIQALYLRHEKWKDFPHWLFLHSLFTLHWSLFYNFTFKHRQPATITKGHHQAFPPTTHSASPPTPAPSPIPPSQKRRTRHLRQRQTPPLSTPKHSASPPTSASSPHVRLQLGAIPVTEFLQARGGAGESQGAILAQTTLLPPPVGHCRQQSVAGGVSHRPPNT